MSETTKNLNSFSVLLKDTGASQISFFVIKELNKLAETSPEIDATIFYENVHKNCIPVNFATMQISECYSQPGPAIATSFSTAQKLRNFYCGKKLFYVWDLHWIRNNAIKKYEDYADIYSDKNLELIARSESHKHAIQTAFNREVKHVIPDFRMSKILEVLYE